MTVKFTPEFIAEQREVNKRYQDVWNVKTEYQDYLTAIENYNLAVSNYFDALDKIETLNKEIQRLQIFINSLVTDDAKKQMVDLFDKGCEQKPQPVIIRRKVTCPVCQTFIEVDVDSVTRSAVCPACENSFTTAY